MTVEEVAAALQLQLLCSGKLEREVTGGYASDLLSCVMARAKAGNLWVTLQAHPNVIAVASLLELAAVIITEGVVPDVDTVQRAQEHGVTLLGSQQTTFEVVGRLGALGVAAGSHAT